MDSRAPLPFAVTLSLLVASAASAGSIEGTVREKGTRTPIPAALLYVHELEGEALSDEEGRFFISLPDKGLPGALTLEVESPGYDPVALSLPAPADDKTLKLDVYLAPNDDADAVTRVRERRSTADRARGVHRISGREVNELPGTYGDPAKAIENMPGMGRVLRSQGSLFVRGARPEDTAVYVDDFEVPDLYHFTGSTSVINIPFVDSVELVPGAFSARYGRATGGLVVLHTKKLPTDDLHGMAKLDVIDGGAYVGVPMGDKAAVGVSARRSFLDAIRWGQRAMSGTGDDVMLIPTYWDWQLKLDWDVTAGHELVVFAFGSGDRELYALDGSATAEPYEEMRDSDFARVGMRYSHLLGGGFTHTITPMIGYERRLHDVLMGYERRSRDTFEAQLRDEVVWRDETTRVAVGVDATARADYVQLGGAFAPPLFRELPAADIDGLVRAQRYEDTVARGTVGLYAEGTFEPLERLSLTPGVRFDAYWYRDVPELSIEPRAAASYEAVEGPWGTTVKAGAGVFSRPPDPEDLVVAERYGRQLEPSKALHLQAGFEQGFGDIGTLSTTVFSIMRDHVPIRAPTFPASEDPLASPIAMTAGQVSNGAELLFRFAASSLGYGWVSYTLARHEVRDGVAAFAVRYPYAAEGDTTHLLALVGQLKLGWGFRLGGRYRVATGMPHTPITGGIFDADAGRYLPVYAAKASSRFEAFQALDLRVDWSLLLPWLEVAVYADLVNVHSVLDSLLGVNATEDLVYNADYTAANEVKGLPLIPTVGVKATF